MHVVRFVKYDTRRDGGPGKVQLLETRTTAPPPRKGDWVTITADDASWTVDRVDWDYTTKPPTAEVWVR